MTGGAGGTGSGAIKQGFEEKEEKEARFGARGSKRKRNIKK